MKGSLCQFIQSAQASATAGQNKSGGNLAVEAGALQVVADQREQFHRARLDDVRKHVREDGARRAIADAGNFNRAIFLHECRCSTAVPPLEALCFRDGRAQTNRKIIREVVSANGNGAGVTHDSAAVDDQFGSAAADVQQAATEVALVLGEASLGRSERLENGIADEDSCLIRGADQILSRSLRPRLASPRTSATSVAACWTSAAALPN